MTIIELTQTLQVKNLFERLTNHKKFGVSRSIVISSDFQRGDEESGVWSVSKNRQLIDSIFKEFPIGNITLVKDYQMDEEPWKVLDGANRCRAIRDFYLNKFTDVNGKKFSDLDAETQARFKTNTIQFAWVTIEKNDPPNTISEMFKRLNTTGDNLLNGELIKGHGWKGNVPEIEMAKEIIQDGWTSRIADENVKQRIAQLRINWNNSLPGNQEIGETKRCESLAMMCGFIISAKTSNFENFRNEYAKLHSKFTNPYAPEDEPEDENNMTPEKELNIINKLNNFIDIMSQINHSSFGNIKKGFYPKKHISPIWKRICEGNMTDAFKTKLIQFYNEIGTNSDLKVRYMNELNKKGNSNDMRGAGGSQLVENLLNFIENWDNQ